MTRTTADADPSSFDCSPIHVVRTHFLAGTSRIPVGKSPRLFPIRANVSGACYILCGRGEITEDRTGIRHAFSPGCFIQWMPDDPHTRILYPDQLYVDKYFVFPPEFYWICHKMGLTSPEHPVIDLGVHPEIAAGYDDLIRELRDQTELKLPLTIEKAFSFLLHQLLPHSVEERKYLRQMEEAARILEADFQEKCSIPALARSLKMSHTSFRRVFARFYRMSPREYRIRRKIEKIQLLLSTRDLRLKEVADRFGYADVYTFSHQFKKMTGVSPAEFRNRSSGISSCF